MWEISVDFWTPNWLEFRKLEMALGTKLNFIRWISLECTIWKCHVTMTMLKRFHPIWCLTNVVLFLCIRYRSILKWPTHFTWIFLKEHWSSWWEHTVLNSNTVKVSTRQLNALSSVSSHSHLSKTTFALVSEL